MQMSNLFWVLWYEKLSPNQENEIRQKGMLRGLSPLRRSSWVSCFNTPSQDKWQDRECCPSGAKWLTSEKLSFETYHIGSALIAARAKTENEGSWRGEGFGRRAKGRSCSEVLGSINISNPASNPSACQDRTDLSFWSLEAEHPIFTTVSLQCSSLSRIEQTRHSFMVCVSLWTNIGLEVYLGDVFSTYTHYK